MKHTLNEKKKSAFRTAELVVLTVIASTATVFADATSVGQNFGEWAMGQIWWVALAIVAFMAVKYLIKKAWIPCGIFVLIGSMILVVIKNPEKLSSIGEAMFNIIFK
ncbi:hypothetical protein [Sinanaerobacter sp. ZZT-01]|uniref:hypothetical protein n=1 Tax=Sinanaerobacter sp. ZZT-01 TaxID=3111540 RepID=UPI002D76D81B|nr:hypothetical protein [Sinanaerobacter sp. ZZT-01]WRR94189.1 hypothetical protein U5921_03460 [Sinanaerobacter sp. ZZT-01]